MAINSDIFAQFFRFGLVGFTNTAVNYGVYAVLLYLGLHYLAASIAAFVVSVLWSYALNSHFVFKAEEGSERSVLKSLAKTFVSYAATGLILTNVLLVIEIEVFSVNGYIAPLLNLLVTVPLNFLLNRNWAFKS